MIKYIGSRHDAIASSVKNDFLALIRSGIPLEDALNSLRTKWSSSIEQKEEEPYFRLPLAATQFEYCCLMDEVRLKALAFVEQGADLAWLQRILGGRPDVLNWFRKELLSSSSIPPAIMMKFHLTSVVVTI